MAKLRKKNSSAKPKRLLFIVSFCGAVSQKKKSCMIVHSEILHATFNLKVSQTLNIFGFSLTCADLSASLR